MNTSKGRPQTLTPPGEPAITRGERKGERERGTLPVPEAEVMAVWPDSGRTTTGGGVETHNPNNPKRREREMSEGERGDRRRRRRHHRAHARPVIHQPDAATTNQSNPNHVMVGPGRRKHARIRPDAQQIWGMQGEFRTSSLL